MINLDEPEYEALVSRLSAEDIPTLVELSKEPDLAIATKAISCLGHMGNERALAGLREAVDHQDPVRRVAAANSLQNMANVQGSVQLLERLLDDNDIGVRKFALKTVEAGNISQLKEKVRVMNEREVNPSLKTLSQQVLQRLR